MQSSWFDADTIILNDKISWSIFLPPEGDFDDIHFLGTKDWTGFNCGVFFLRITEWTPGMEQNAMAWVLAQKGCKEHAIYQPGGWYNGFHEGPDQRSEDGLGDLLVHFPGVGQKFNAMARYLDKLENPEPAKDLQVALSNMNLAEAEQLLKKPSLGGQVKEPVNEPKRLLLEDRRGVQREKHDTGNVGSRGSA
ncbi:MAG: hypothetical protein Q9161_003462 [Pseudevernia consocians]